jgi:hypothetical protein
MEFTLIYEGPLPAAGTSGKRVKEKHEIRMQLHPQLQKLWELKLPHWLVGTQTSRLSRRWTAGQPIVDQIKIGFQNCRHEPPCKHRFVPLVRNDLMLACKLEILFLRRDSRQGAIVENGDLDNRLKVLLDGLRAPTSCDELPENTGPVDCGTYCLLQDDKLITDIRITTDTLLTPKAQDEAKSYVHLVISVKLWPIELHAENADFA